MDDGEDISNSIREIFLEASDDHGDRFFHSLECTMKSDTIRAIFTKQNKDACNEILNDLDACLSTKFIDVPSCVSFRSHQSVKVFISMIEQHKSQHQVKFNAYARRIAKRLCKVNPNEPDESFDTVPLRTPKQRINVSYATAVATPYPQPASLKSNYVAPSPNVDMIDMSLYIPTHTGGNSNHLAELESSLLFIQSGRTSMQSDQKQLRNEFQEFLTGVLTHSKEIQAMQSDVRGLTSMMQEIRNAILTNAPLCRHALHSQP
jgi:hypothetical protein